MKSLIKLTTLLERVSTMVKNGMKVDPWTSNCFSQNILNKFLGYARPISVFVYKRNLFRNIRVRV